MSMVYRKKVPAIPLICNRKDNYSCSNPDLRGSIEGTV